MTIVSSGPGFGRQASGQVPALWESPPDVSAGMVFWAFEQGVPGAVEYVVRSGSREVYHYVTGDDAHNGQGTCSGSVLHGGGTFSIEVLSSTHPAATYTLGWGSMADDTDPSHFTLTPATLPDPAFQGGLTADGYGFMAAPMGFGDPGIHLIGSDAESQTPTGQGGLNPDGSYWGWWLVKDSQDPSNGVVAHATDPTRIGLGPWDTYDTAQVHLLISRQPVERTNIGYAPGSPWGDYTYPDESIALTEASYSGDPNNLQPTGYRIVANDLILTEFTLKNELVYATDSGGTETVAFVTRQGVTRGQGTYYQYGGKPGTSLKVGSLNVWNGAGWLRIGSDSTTSSELFANEFGPNVQVVEQWYHEDRATDDPAFYYNDADFPQPNRPLYIWNGSQWVYIARFKTDIGIF